MVRRLVALLLLISSAALAGGHRSTSGTVSVHGYTTRTGTYVAPHQRTAPDHTKSNNWSTRGNVNPITGKPGTKPADR